MSPSLMLSAALLAPAAPVPRDTVPNVSGPAPRVVAVKADAGGAVRISGYIPTKQTGTATQVELDADNKEVQKQFEYDYVSNQQFNKTLADFNGKFATAGGTPLTLAEATARVKGGATLLASADGKPVCKSWLRAAAPDTVVMVADGFAHAQLPWGSDPLPTTPAPRLTLLATDAKGAVLAQVTSNPANGNEIFYDNGFDGGGRIRGRAVRFKGDYAYYGTQPVEAKVTSKPLADVTFDAYDRTGRLVPRRDALNRLAAGGMVLVAGDTRMPDESYLKVFDQDVLILVASELVLPIPPVDQTKKKTPAAQAPVPAVAGKGWGLFQTPVEKK